MDFPPNLIEQSRRQLGAGKDFTGLGAEGMAAVIAEAAQCDAGQLPTLWQVRDHFQGPLLDANINVIFQPQTDILALGKAAPGAANVAVTQGLINGQLQTPSLICGVFVHVSTSPWTATIPGNSITKPVATYNNDYVSPDTFTLGDVTAVGSTAGNNTALGVAQGATPGATGFRRATMDIGRWAQEGLWAFCRAFNFTWSYGDKTTLLDWPLRFMAWMEDTVQEGSSGAGPISIAPYVAAMNTYYTNSGASTDIFLPRNARRTGSVTGTAGNVVSTFSPDDSFRTVVPTVGGISLYDALSPNSKVFTLPRPVLYPRGVSLGMFLNLKDQVAFGEMQAAFSITQGLGLASTPVATVPPAFTPFGLIPAGFPATAPTAGLTFLEQTKDLSPVQNALSVRTDEVLYKWGDLYIGIGAVGYELTENQYRAIAQNLQSVTDVLNGLGCPCQIL
jgi:hypothetical protein